MRSFVLGLTLLATACSYKPGSFTYPGHGFAGTHETIGCLDLSIERRKDYEGAAIVHYEFGNRCDDPAIVDLAYARVFGRTIDGNEVTLVPYDPKNELRSARIDGRSFGSEALAYNPPETDSGAQIAQVCIDLATIAHIDGTRVVCLATDAPPDDRAPEQRAPDEPATPYDGAADDGSTAVEATKQQPRPAQPQATDAEDPT